MLQVRNSLVNTVADATIYSVIAKTSVTNCTAYNSISPTYTTTTGSNNVAVDNTGDIQLADVFTNGMNAQYQIKQSYADTNLVGQGWNGSDIGGWAYYDDAGATNHTFTGTVGLTLDVTSTGVAKQGQLTAAVTVNSSLAANQSKQQGFSGGVDTNAAIAGALTKVAELTGSVSTTLTHVGNIAKHATLAGTNSLTFDVSGTVTKETGDTHTFSATIGVTANQPSASLSKASILAGDVAITVDITGNSLKHGLFTGVTSIDTDVLSSVEKTAILLAQLAVETDVSATATKTGLFSPTIGLESGLSAFAFNPANRIDYYDMRVDGKIVAQRVNGGEMIIRLDGKVPFMADGRVDGALQ